jgi:PhzF family phenazine biosynthesis protein
MAGNVYHLRIFADGQYGGNPLPLVVDAAGMADADMQSVAASAGHESGFVFLAPEHSNYDYEFRFWVPEHEMEMCGHATVGAVWMLERLGRLPRNNVRIWTKSGIVEAIVTKRMEGTWVEISQGKGVVETISNDTGIYEDFLSTLGMEASGLSQQYPIQNSKTSRVKTVIPVQSVSNLDGIHPKPQAVRSLCERVGSTGLYPFAVIVGEGKQVFSARQFPKNSGYIEDAATGIAASALAFALLENGLVDMESEITVKQGRAMGAPSSISIRFRMGESGEIEGCWIGGTAVLEEFCN